MFVAIYRWRLKAGCEESFRAAWGRITDLARERCGSGGSALFRAEDGTWVAVARWPERAARERCFAAGPLDADAMQQMREAVAENLPGYELDAVDDRWTPFAETEGRT
jgi:heme-degrading monooxygenase HmoA